MKVAVVGTGYVGLVTGACLAEKGHHVTCFDKIAEKVVALSAGIIPIYEPGLKEMVERNTVGGRLAFTTEVTVVTDADVVFIAVGTPPGVNGEADLAFVRDAAGEIARSITSYTVVVTKSTVPVGTNDMLTRLMAEQTAIPFDLVSNPEFLREGSAVDDAMYPDRIVIGSQSDRAVGVMRELYQGFDAPIVITDPHSAEMIKYAANAFLAVKISFINEIAGLCERIGGDVLEVAKGIGLDPRIGPAFLRAGIGFGGSCFPKDTQALVHMAHQSGYQLPVLEGAMGVNDRQRTVLVERLRSAFGSLEGKVVAVLGLAFKPNTDDVREAAALEIMKNLAALGADVRACDPQALQTGKRAWEEMNPPGRVSFCESALEAVEGADALLLATEWPEFAALPWEEVRGKMRGDLILDGRNFLNQELLTSLDFQYSGIGRGVQKSAVTQPINL